MDEFMNAAIFQAKQGRQEGDEDIGREESGGRGAGPAPIQEYG